MVMWQQLFRFFFWNDLRQTENHTFVVVCANVCSYSHKKKYYVATFKGYYNSVHEEHNILFQN